MSNQFIGQAPRYIIEVCALILVSIVAVVVTGRPGGLEAALPVLGAFALGALRLLPMLQQFYNGWVTIAGFRNALMDVVDILELPVQAELLVRSGCEALAV
jgi:hypothetical protein